MFHGPGEGGVVATIHVDVIKCLCVECFYYSIDMSPVNLHNIIMAAGREKRQVRLPGTSKFCS